MELAFSDQLSGHSVALLAEALTAESLIHQYITRSARAG
jgi:hypothetical protein